MKAPLAAAPPRATVRRADAAALAGLAGRDFSFEVHAELAGPFDEADIGRPVPVVPSYRKRYDFDLAGRADDLGRSDRAAFVADVLGRPVGFVTVSRGWHDYAVIDGIAVDAGHRRAGIARGLVDAAVAWAVDASLPGLRLETQSTNVAACRFYQRCGFMLGGHDHYLYRALHPGTREVALFWYLPLGATR